MDALRVALAQVNPTVGDLAGNAARILDRTTRAAAQGAQVVVFGRGALTGHPLHDLALRPAFTQAADARLTDLAQQLHASGARTVAVVLSCLGTDAEGQPVETAAVLQHGRITRTCPAPDAPTYAGSGPQRSAAILTVGEHHLAVTLGTDAAGPIGGGQPAPDTAADAVLVLDAKPYEHGNAAEVRDQVSAQAVQWHRSVVWVNLVGGQDEVVFDGGSVAVDETGEMLAGAPLFREHTGLVDLGLPPAQQPRMPDAGTCGPSGATTVTQTYQALVLGLGDYVRKNGFTSVVLGLSGGIDSALVAAIAVDALGPQHVVGVSMPSAFSSQHSKDDAADLADRLGLPAGHYRTVPIEPYVDALRTGLGLTGVAEENLQARVRGLILMALSNSEGHLVLAPGNKSELAVGYSTIYGDAVGGYAPLKDVSKSRVWQLARDRNARARAAGQREPIPEHTIAKEPSAELRPGQRDTDSLPGYDVLDPLLQAYVEQRRTRSQLLQQGFDAQILDRVLPMVDRAEWKRGQYPVGPAVTAVAFGSARRVPVTNAFTEPGPR